ncbi:TldD/PmbA family protein [Thermocrinis sp.]|uniref:TldD/PmbA family protein n=1 Tax=Thermocrinis sp. TaxID=2024383 RepID=UPI002FDE28F9
MENLRKWVEAALKDGYDYEVYLESTEKLLVETSNEQQENLSKSKELGLGIRVLKDFKQGFAYTTEISQDSVIKCVKRAIESLELTPEDRGFVLNKNPVQGELKAAYDSEGTSISLEDRIEILINLEKLVKKFDNRIVGSRKSSLKELKVEVYCLNSYGLEYSYKTTYFSCFTSALAVENGEEAISYEYRAGRFIKDIDFEEMAKDVSFKATAQLGASSYETKVIPVIFFRDSAALLLEAFSPMFLGDSLVKDKTMLKGKENTPVGSSVLTIIDDGTLEHGLGSLEIDAEGILSKKNVIIEKGIFKRFLHSLYTAVKCDTEPTGNSVRNSFKSLPTSGIRNLYIEKGPYSLEDLLNIYDETFFVLDLMGLHTVDPISGDFSLGASGIILKKGRKEKAVKGVVIGGNVKDLWGKLVGVGEDLRMYGHVGSPSLLIESITVGS